MPDWPTGTITFLFTDIEGSTARWERHPEIMRAAVARHDELLHSLMAAHGGIVFKTVGDAFYAVFTAVSDALHAALAVQRAVAAEIWPEEVRPFRVRIAFHTGEAELRGNDYFGQSLNRVARILSSGHGGQILLSSISRSLMGNRLPAGISLLDLGEHRLKDIELPEHIFQVVAADLQSEFPALKTSGHHHKTLPTQLTPFVGRKDELRIVSALLLRSDIRLVTLTGPGGTGKTRLSLQVALDSTAAFPDGIYFVDLSTIRDAHLVVSTISQTLGIQETGGKPILERLAEYLNGRALLMLDNFEQVADAAPLVSQLLMSCPQLKVLVTSRSALHIVGEQEYHVQPLAVPASKPRNLSELMQYDAIALFVQQARAVQLDFNITWANVGAVVEICNRLDGLPLAIELAAARINLLPPQAMLKRLEKRLQLLKGSQRNRTERQNTLRGAIGWSYDLLNADERGLFLQLAIFAGGCTLDAIENICSVVESLDADLLDVLHSLIDKSLLRQQELENDEPRFVMLHTIREFALEHLQETGDNTALRQRYINYFLEFAELAAPELISTEQKFWLKRLDDEHDNLLLALWWCAEQGEVESGLRLAGALWRFWLMRSHMYEGRFWLDKFLNHPQAETVTTVIRARTLEGASALACRQKDYESAAILARQALTLSQQAGDREIMSGAYISLAEVAYVQGESQKAIQLFEESLRLRRVLGDRRGTASLLNNLGNVLLRQGEVEKAVTLFEESLTLFRMVGDTFATASVLNNLAEIEQRRNNLEQATILYEESLKQSRTSGYSWGIAATLANLGNIARLQGNHQRALDAYKESLALFEKIGDRLGLALCLEGLAEVMYAQNRLEQAIGLFAQAEITRKMLGTSTLQHQHPVRENVLAVLRTAIDEDTFVRLWHSSCILPLDQVLAEVFV